jgi:UDP-N-acetylmuramoyl-tripeptide--D-alanyl-D-alanine ligase
MDCRTLEQITQMVGGELYGSGDTIAVTKIVTDSRSIQSGEFFVALHGDQFDGHKFLPEVHEAGAAGALVDRINPGVSGLPQIEVEDTLIGLQRLAKRYRSEINLQVIGVTGSNGKTSTKEMIAAVLGEKFAVAKTIGNLNNHIGVPLTILEAGSQDQVGVFEMGMNHAGELALLVDMAQPRIGVITNIGITHIGHFDSREAIAKEKAVVAEAIPTEGSVVLNAQDDFSDWIADRCVARVVRTGVNAGDVQASDLRHSENGEQQFTLVHDSECVPVRLPVLGEHMVSNACLAVAVGLEFGLTLAECASGLEKTVIPGNRLKIQKFGSLLILNDAYNANPDSMIAALKTALNIPVTGRRVAALGNMGELGHKAELGHRQVGKAVAELGFRMLVTVGDEARFIVDAARAAGLAVAKSFETHEQAVEALNGFLKPGDLLLVKGSRSAAMERIVVGLEAVQNDAKWRAL